jgi:hypothetical protein
VLSFRNFGARIYLIGWLLLLSIFAARTLPDFFNNIATGKIISPTPNASTDGFLIPLLRVSRPSARLTQVFAELPANCSILFVSAQGDDRWDFVYSAVSYLSWPRPIDRVELQPNEKFGRAVADGTAVMFCGTPVAIDSRSRVEIGPSLVLLKPVTSP